MKSYRDWAPTPFDVKGLNCEDRQNWLVAPCSQNRDSCALARSNFEAQIKRLGGESATVEVHRFGHWACGWLEIVIVKPESKAAEECDRIESELEDYPVLDEDHYSSLQCEDANEYWQNMADWQRKEALEDAGIDLRAYRRKFPPFNLDGSGRLWRYLTEY